MTTTASPVILGYNSSKSSPGKVYELRLSRRDGTVYCTCPGWIFSKTSPKMCKHLRTYLGTVREGNPVVFGTLTEAEAIAKVVKPASKPKQLTFPVTAGAEYEELVA